MLTAPNKPTPTTWGWLGRSQCSTSPSAARCSSQRPRRPCCGGSRCPGPSAQRQGPQPLKGRSREQTPPGESGPAVLAVPQRSRADACGGWLLGGQRGRPQVPAQFAWATARQGGAADARAPPARGRPRSRAGRATTAEPLRRGPRAISAALGPRCLGQGLMEHGTSSDCSGTPGRRARTGTLTLSARQPAWAPAPPSQRAMAPRR